MFLKLFGPLWNIPAKIPGYPTRKLIFPGFRGTYRTFWPSPLHEDAPHPAGRYPEPKVLVCGVFSCLMKEMETLEGSNCASVLAVLRGQVLSRQTSFENKLPFMILTPPETTAQKCAFLQKNAFSYREMSFPTEKCVLGVASQETAGNRRRVQGSRIKNASQLSQESQNPVNKVRVFLFKGALRGFPVQGGPKHPKIEKIQSRLKFSISLEIFNACNLIWWAALGFQDVMKQQEIRINKEK